MMLEEKKIKLLFFLILAWLCASDAGDTQTLKKLSFSVAIINGLHDAIISLDDNGNLLFKGLIVQKLDIPHDPFHILKINLEYVADKNGYKAKYVLTREDVELRQVSAATLKSLTG